MAQEIEAVVNRLLQKLYDELDVSTCAMEMMHIQEEINFIEGLEQ